MIRNITSCTQNGHSLTISASGLCLLCLLLFSSCASPPDLLAFGQSITADVDLTGSWQRDDTISDAKLPRLESITNATQEPDPGRRVPSKTKKSKGPGAAVLLDGLYLSAKKLRVTQESTAIFVKFDLARVEEYRFGEKRELNVGPIAVLRVSGWEDDRYYIKSITDQHVLIEERYYMSDNGLRLHRDVQIEGKNIPLRTVRQVFNRVP